VGVAGEFEAGAVVEIRDGAGKVLARGMAAMSSRQVTHTMGRRSGDFEQFGVTEVVHRDDMVVFSRL
jgi:glutamate 5-kinase